MTDVHEHERRLLRRRMSASRSRLCAADVARLSRAGCERLLSLPSFRAARHVVLYSAIDNEMDPAAVAEGAIAAGKSVYYPAGSGTEPSFHRVDEVPGSCGRRGLLAATNGVSLTSAETSVLFVVPGLAFDPHGARLGRGDGWYDRALARHPAAARVGLAYEFQVVPGLPEAPWDIRMHAVVTDARLLGEAPALAGE